MTCYVSICGTKGQDLRQRDHAFIICSTSFTFQFIYQIHISTLFCRKEISPDLEILSTYVIRLSKLVIDSHVQYRLGNVDAFQVRFEYQAFSDFYSLLPRSGGILFYPCPSITLFRNIKII